MASPPDPDPSRSTRPLITRPLWLLYTCTALIILALAAGEAAVVMNLRATTLRNAEANLHNVSLALAEQADRTVQGLDLVLTSIGEFVHNEGVVDGASYRQLMGDFRVHRMLQEKLVGLPYINAITMIDPDGRLINFSRFWPIPSVNIADRDYFKAMRADPTLERFISAPVPNRGDGVWTVYLARRVHSQDGSFAGLLLGAIELHYFQELYRSVSMGEGTAISLLRQDGTLLARYPPTAAIGVRVPLGADAVTKGNGSETARDTSSIDGLMRIKASQQVANFPLTVRVTQSETSVLQAWQRMAWMLGLITASCVAAVLAAALAVGRWWFQQQTLAQTRAERAEAERGRALVEADLLRERERSAEAASRGKSDFLAVMSHEIRTPMNAVLGLAGTLLETDLSGEQRRFVEAIRTSGDSLLRLLNDVLDYSKLDAGRMSFEVAPFPPATITQSAVSILGPRAIAKGLQISATTDPDLPPALLGDAGRIRQILLNLVSNAVKFTDTGSVTIHAHCLARVPAVATVEWCVTDTGIGVPPDRLDRLFGEFMQADSSISRRFGGTGLGLAISKRLIDQMHGTIGVESTPGVGSTFRFRLTLPCVELPVEAPTTRADPRGDLAARIATLGRKLRILFAEDNSTNQFVALQLLKDLDLKVDMVADGLEAVEAAGRFPYDLIFMDVRMPEMDGMTATRLIRKQAGPLADIPIIALTANAFPEDVKACFDAGMTKFVPKPVNKKTLLTAILDALAGTPHEDQVELPEQAVPAEPPADRAVLQTLSDDLGEDGMAEMFAVFCTETRARLRRMAAEGVDPTVLLREVHTLKGAAGTVGAALLTQRSIALEARLKQGDALTQDDLARLGEAFEAYQQAAQPLFAPAPAA